MPTHGLDARGVLGSVKGPSLRSAVVAALDPACALRGSFAVCAGLTDACGGSSGRRDLATQELLRGPKGRLPRSQDRFHALVAGFRTMTRGPGLLAAVQAHGESPRRTRNLGRTSGVVPSAMLKRASTLESTRRRRAR